MSRLGNLHLNECAFFGANAYILGSFTFCKCTYKTIDFLTSTRISRKKNLKSSCELWNLHHVDQVTHIHWGSFETPVFFFWISRYISVFQMCQQHTLSCNNYVQGSQHSVICSSSKQQQIVSLYTQVCGCGGLFYLLFTFVKCLATYFQGSGRGDIWRVNAPKIWINVNDIHLTSIIYIYFVNIQWLVLGRGFASTTRQLRALPHPQTFLLFKILALKKVIYF